MGVIVSTIVRYYNYLRFEPELDQMESHVYADPEYCLAVTRGNIKQLNAFLANNPVYAIDQLFRYGNLSLSMMHLACEAGRPGVVEELISRSADVNIQDSVGRTPLFIASQENHLSIVKILIENKADVNLQEREKCSPLFIASHEGHHEVVTLLIEAKADVNLQEIVGCSPLYIASRFGYTEVVKVLIGAKADLNLTRGTGSMPLYIASRFGHSEVVKELINAGADVNIKQSRGSTPLYVASQNGHYEVVKLLTAANADVEIRNRSERSPLFIASKNNFYQIVKHLADTGADTLIQDDCMQSPLFAASQMGHRKVVNFLLSHKVGINSINTTDASGRTPLFIACQEGHIEVVELLIDAGADFNIRRNTGFSPLDIANQNGHSQVARVLLKASKGSMPQQSGSANDLIAVNSPNIDEELHKAEQLLSQELHEALTTAGFVRLRAVLQSAMSEVLEQILSARFPRSKIYIVGSYAEGFGSSIVALDGRIDLDSDIDVMHLVRGRKYHVEGHCHCLELPNGLQKCKYRNGHIECKGYATHPALSIIGTTLRPAVDQVSAYRLCNYPPIEILQESSTETCISPVLLKQMKADLAIYPCHVVQAADPGHAGRQLRVSTTFLERRLLRSLTTVQGQFQIMLKYIFKKIISPRTKGRIKSYHAKTIMFRMLDRTPDCKWRVENLVWLGGNALEMLINDLKRGSGRRSNEKIVVMNHFLLTDVTLHAKEADESSVTLDELIQIVEQVKRSLPHELDRFMDSLAKNINRYISFQPFLFLPMLRPRPVIKTTNGQYHEIFDVIETALIQLSDECSRECLTKTIEKLPPTCAGTARSALQALTCLKFKDTNGAKRVLLECSGRVLSHGINLPAHESEATVDYVWRHIKSHDCAWKICFWFERRPNLGFLPGIFVDCFPCNLEVYDNYFYINFDALIKGLSLELDVQPAASNCEGWFKDCRHRGDADMQEVAMTLLFCKDMALIDGLVKKHKKMIMSYDCTKKAVEILENRAAKNPENSVTFLPDELRKK